MNAVSGFVPHAHRQMICDAYRSLGCSVYLSGCIGFGFPHLILGFNNRTELADIQVEHGELGASGRAFAREWKGSLVRIIRTTQDVADHVQSVKSQIARGK
jgi:hypothetical protein